MSHTGFSFTTVINSNATVSSAFNVSGFNTIGILAPAGLTSTQAFLQVAPSDQTEPNSASYLPLYTWTPASGQLVRWTWPLQNGSCAAVVTNPDLAPWSWMRIQLGVGTSSALTTWTIVGKRAGSR
jgi:hypothetical protein